MARPSFISHFSAAGGTVRIQRIALLADVFKILHFF